jgi:hypothetical protein
MNNRIWLALTLVVAIGCGSTEPKATVNGTWTGTTSSSQVLTLHLAQSGSAVTGSGTISNTPSGTVAETVTGTFDDPSFNATLTASTFEPIAISAHVTDDAMTATLTGSGFTGDALTLYRSR